MALKFGKYAGCDLREVPTEYPEFLLGEQERTGSEIVGELERRRMAEEAAWSWAERIVNVGYRSLVKEGASNG